MKASSTNFYSNLEVHESAISNLIGDKDKFAKIPEDWHILVADIRNSTLAVQQGQHNTVNLVATGCVIAILNLAEARQISVPFFFGGDGAVFLIPDEILPAALSVLEKHNNNSFKNFGFSLSIGSFNVADIYKKNIELQVARVKVNKYLNIPVILGGGLQYAEDQIKLEHGSQEIELEETPLNLKGMECKWDKIKPLKKNHEIVSLIIAGCGNNDFSKVYSEVLENIDEIYGSVHRRKPISVERLKIKASLHRINTEMKSKIGKWDLFIFLHSLMIAYFGEIFLKNTNTGKSYLKKLVESSDNLTLDGRINTVISGSHKQRKKLLEYLDDLERQNLIKYGYHVSEESIMSCYVKDMSTDQHIHFIDGGNGGYTKAANLLKSKFQNQPL